jgi:predicted porin
MFMATGEAKMKKYKWTIAAALAVILTFGFMAYSTVTASASDLGGNCCADLEERIAELEVVTAKTGNRKTSVKVYGRVSEALVWSDLGDYNDWSVGSNSNAPSFLGVGGQYRITNNWTAKYDLQIGFGGYEASGMGYGHLEGDTHGIYLRNASLSLESDSFGALTIGKTKQATDGVSTADRSNSWIVSTPLSGRPITGEGVGEVFELFDGTRANVLRYDSPVVAGGLWFSGSIAASNTDVMGATDGSVWDVAVKYWGELGDFKVAAGAGYREGIWMEDDALMGGPLSLAIDGTPTVMSGSASVLHAPSGIFVNGTYGDMDLDPIPVSITGYAVKVGIEKGLLQAAGKGLTGMLDKTTVFVEYGKWDLSELGTTDIDYWGAGVVQTFGPVALYASGRKYDIMGEDATVIMVGMSANF